MIYVVFVLVFPLFLTWAEKKNKAVKTISPIILCYAVGLLLANVNFIKVPKEMATTLSEVAVPLAIPLLLISTKIKQWIKGARGAIVSFLLCVLAVTITATIGAFLFQDQILDSWKLAGMTVGVYTGGTPNMSAIGLSLDVPEETFILMNASDLVWGALYLLFLMTLAKPIFGLLLSTSSEKLEDENDSAEAAGFGVLSFSDQARNILIFLGVAVLLLGAGVGLAILLTGKMHAIVIILFVTTAGIGLSFSKLQPKPGSYELGDYFLLVFCLALGSMADVSELVSSASDTLLFTGFVMFGAIILHVLFAAIFKLDRDTVIITSVAGIYGPAFVGPIAKVLNNKSVILTGMTTGLIGYAVGNYLGIGLAMVLKGWF